jgi:tetratricopeptide (TPR) repeat protein
MNTATHSLRETEVGLFQMLANADPQGYRRAAVALCLCFLGNVACAQTRGPDATLTNKTGVVEYRARDTQSAVEVQSQWMPLYAGDWVRTREDSSAVVLMTMNNNAVRLGELSSLEILPTQGDSTPWLHLWRGALYFFSRDRSHEVRIRTPHATGAPRGTEYLLMVSDDQTLLAVLDGSAELTNESGATNLQSGEVGMARPGQPPVRIALEARNIIQWWLYYPGVLDVDELAFEPADRGYLKESLDAYHSGDLLKALFAYPGYPKPDTQGSEAQRIYLAGLYLAAGQLGKTESLLASVTAGNSLAAALRWVIAAVQQEVDQPTEMHTSASEWLGLSYYYQARHELPEALSAAREAVDRSPNFAFGWERLAELEFSFGRVAEARHALNRSLDLAPRNAQSHALQGFLFSAEGVFEEAMASFNEAILLDSSLGNAWLGRGLVKIRKGDAVAGRADLQMAAILEPNRSLLRSYFGKAFSDAGDFENAALELRRAVNLDPKDPTPWLYSALLNQQNGRINEGIGDLEQSQELNDNRRVYRSRLLLDQDRAVRSANLAQLYQDNGMTQVAVREATRAVESDYANASAHLFLANAYDALRDPTRVELRHETPWFHELLLANLLSPVGGGRLSQFVSQQEYSKLLETDGLGASILNEWRSDSEIRSIASVFGTHGKTSFGLDVSYWKADGDRPNADDRRTEIYAQFKYEVTPNDIFYFLGKWQDQESGDTFKTYDNRPLSSGLRFDETQAPGLLLAGWNHQWVPGANTLLLGGRLGAEQTLSNPRAMQHLLERNPTAMYPGFVQVVGDFHQFTDPALQDASPPAISLSLDGQSLIYSPELLATIAPFLGMGEVIGVSEAPFDFHTRRRFEIYSAELQHIQQLDQNTVVLGGRVQQGEFETDVRLSLIRPSLAGGFSTPAADQHSITDFERTSLYVYDFWNVVPGLTLIGGTSWDRIKHPDNFRNPPVNDGQREDEQLSGKIGFTLSPSRWFTMRGVYMEALGGVTFDESVTLEPVQLAGFSQSYRTVLSESLVGSVEAPRFTVVGLSVEGKLPSQTWWGASFNVIEQDVDRTVGAFTGYDLGVFPINSAFFPGDTSLRLGYREQSFQSTINQLLATEFAVGALYRVTKSELQSTYLEIPTTLRPGAETRDEATLHVLSLFCSWNSPSGLFARAEANWYSQHLQDDPSGPAGGGGFPREGDEFWQFNAFVGYRFNRNRAEVSVGVLNLNDTDYRLSPLNPYENIPRERTAVVRCRFIF